MGSWSQLDVGYLDCWRPARIMDRDRYLACALRIQEAGASLLSPVATGAIRRNLFGSARSSTPNAAYPAWLWSFWASADGAGRRLLFAPCERWWRGIHV